MTPFLCLLLSGAAPPAAGAILPAGAIARIGPWRFRPEKAVGERPPVALSADGLAVACGTMLFDLRTGRRVEIRAIAASRAWDRMTLPVGGLVSLHGASLWAFDTRAGLARKALAEDAGGPPPHVSFSATGRHLAAGIGGEARVWDLDAGKQILTARVPGGDTHVALSPDGERLATWGPPRWPHGAVLVVREVPSGRRIRSFTLGDGWFLHAAFSPDGKEVATVHRLDGRFTLTVRDVATGKTRREAALPPVPLFLRYGPGGRVAVGDENGTVREMDTSTWKVKVFAATRKTSLVGLAYRGAMLVAAGWVGDEVWLWEPGRPESLDGHDKPIRALAFTPDGGLISAGDDLARVWSAGGYRQVRTFKYSPRGEWAHVSFSPDGGLLAAGRWNGKSASFFDTASGEHVGAVDAPLHVWGPTSFSSDGRKLLMQDRSGKPATPAWLADMKVRKAGFTGTAASSFPTALSPDGTRIAGEMSSPGRHRGVVRDGSGNEEFTFWSPPSTRAVAWSPDGRMIAAAGHGEVSLVDAGTGAGLGAVKADGFQAESVAWSPDGRLVAAAMNAHGRPRILVVEAASAAERFTLEGHAGPVHALAFSPDGSALASGGADGDLLVWDMTGREHARHASSPPSAKDWAALVGKDAGAAWRSLAKLVCLPTEGVALLRKNLKPARDAAKVTLGLRRAVEALERMRTPESRRHLRELAAGNPDARLTAEAKAALARLEAK